MLGTDDYQEVTYAITAPNDIIFYSMVSGEVMEQQIIPRPEGHDDAEIVDAQSWGNDNVNLRWSSGQITPVRVIMRPVFDTQGERSISTRLDIGDLIEIDSEIVGSNAILKMSSETATVAVQDGPNSVMVTRVSESENFLGEVERKSSTLRVESELPGTITTIEIDEAGRSLYVGTSDGYLGWWNISASTAEMIDAEHVAIDNSAVTALQLVFGDVSIAVGTESGLVTSYFATENVDGARTILKPIHQLLELSSGIAKIVPSRRDKSLLIQDTDGLLHSVHMTSERYLATIETAAPILRYRLSSKGDTVVTYSADQAITVWDLHKPHPESSWATLFSKVWYEKYDEPQYVWQSSASSDDYEPKLSLTPLIFGSFKGTLYAMLLAVPLALLGALYTNQFLSPEIRAIVKPLVEIMASVPSVVIGFLVALWLAPIIEGYVLSFLISFAVVPLTFIPFILFFHHIDGSDFYRRVARGYEFIIAFPIIILGGYFSFLLGPLLETMFFDGDLKLWMYESLGTRYDQRNAIIIAFGLGFVSIPIIFTIAEDALSNLPQSLQAASLALGASRWQTAWRVVLPSASPGIFAAVIIGFGRVIGETMIVLMATGNTPIMDWSPFNGMRTLSANIAVEIPEAPVDGTLYRVLFLSAALLFLLTFTLNSVAEIIRQRLRNKYGRFQ